ncbi:Phosphatidylinositol N-acetylglucosaminyltransferase subunit Y [Paramuricea clavata]|uniref:Phosphatidylinositol N-acetylglucosaminyltransferase subunit Y n=1 Tax=Paramuricea clavata TaxID=317549 RepID=A0A7D9HGN0_PARCT|nr:Phosphatidylinositol N-acetylglucosaminyltransferase subunit Y [Paramuricea clavata]
MSSPILFMFIFCLFIAVVCFGGVTFSLFTSNNFPACCLEYGTACYFGLLIPTTVPVFVVFVYCNWLGHKFFIHN